jgi:hypothetical protein
MGHGRAKFSSACAVGPVLVLVGLAIRFDSSPGSAGSRRRALRAVDARLIPLASLLVVSVAFSLIAWLWRRVS